jgi:hypothetical protein
MLAKKCGTLLATKRTLGGCGMWVQQYRRDGQESRRCYATPLYDGLLVMDREDITFGNTLLPYLTAASSSGTGFDLVVAGPTLVQYIA